MDLMTAQSTLSAGGPPPDRVPLGWLILLPLGALVLLQALFAWFAVVPVFHGELADTDAYMRLVRVLDLHASGDWFDARLLRVNPPEGHVQHWTRLLDALLLGGAWLLEPVLGFRAGLHLWGVLISPVLLALAIIALDWATAPVLSRDARLFACLAFLLQPSIQAYTIVGRPDHHSLLLTLFVVQLGLTVRLLLRPERRPALAAGVIAAIGFWVSPEAVLAIAVSLGAFGLYWLQGDLRMSRVSRDFMLATTAALALALVIERGPGLMVIESDRLSLLHVALFAGIAGFWLLVARVERTGAAAWAQRAARAELSRPPRPFETTRQPAARRGLGKRLVLAVFGMAVIATGMLTLFPSLRAAPLGPIDPLYQHLRLQLIVEYQPLIPGAWLSAGRFQETAQRTVRIMGIALIAVPYLLIRIGRSQAQRRGWMAIGLAMVVFLPLAFAEVHFGTYAQALLVIPYAAGVAWLLDRLDGRLAPSVRQVLRPLLLVVALFWPYGVADALPEASIATAAHACPIDQAAPVLTRLADGAAKTVLTFTDYAPPLLYKTPFRVLSIPNHRPQPGFATTYRILTALDPEAARAEVARHHIDWILLCPSTAEQRQFAHARDDPRTLYRRLVDGAPPPWLRKLPLPPELADAVSLFTVIPTPSAPAAAG
jgi:hypothetical protein